MLASTKRKLLNDTAASASAAVKCEHSATVLAELVQELGVLVPCLEHELTPRPGRSLILRQIRSGLTLAVDHDNTSHLQITAQVSHGSLPRLP